MIPNERTGFVSRPENVLRKIRPVICFSIQLRLDIAFAFSGRSLGLVFQCESYLDPFAINQYVKCCEVLRGKFERNRHTKGETVTFAQKVVLRGKEEDVSTKADESVETERYD